MVTNSFVFHLPDNNSILGKSNEMLIGHPKTNVLDEIIITPIKEETHPNNVSVSHPKSLAYFFEDSGDDSNYKSSVNYTDPHNRGSPNVDSLKSQLTFKEPEERKPKKKLCCRKKKSKLKQGNITLMGDQIINRKTGQKFRDNKNATDNKLLNIIAKIAIMGKNRNIRTIFKKALVILKVVFKRLVEQKSRDDKQGQEDVQSEETKYI